LQPQTWFEQSLPQRFVAQSPLPWQPTQAPLALQIGFADTLAQSDGRRHCTQVFFDGLHRFPVVAVVQSEVVRHWTHRSVAVSHTYPCPQAVLSMHSTHFIVVGSQTCVGISPADELAQSAAPEHVG
jgi:hypothetical protein